MLTYNKFIFINYKLLNLSVSQVNQSNLTNRAWHAALVWSNTMIATVSTNLSVQGRLDAKWLLCESQLHKYSHHTKWISSLRCLFRLREASGLRRYCHEAHTMYYNVNMYITFIELTVKGTDYDFGKYAITYSIW